MNHPCSHCAKAPDEQRHLAEWAFATYGQRPPLTLLAVRAVQSCGTMTTAAVDGDRDLAIKQAARTVVCLYRVASALDADLWEAVTAEIAELQSAPPEGERF